MTTGPSSAPPRGSTAEHARLAQATGLAEDNLFESNPWYEWGPYLQNVPGARSVRTTATMATLGTSSPMIMPDLAPIDGTKTAWRVCPMSVMSCVWRWRYGTASTRS